ncbi:MAG TPA: glucosamine-6-phosphate deaminase [Clostridiales bacterium]|nr:glucosamine-6-phosphate deaminase [Clostridiales bacterium]
MNTVIFSNYEEMCKKIAQEIAEVVKAKPNALLCLAAGHTSLGVFDEMVALARDGAVFFDRCIFVGLDEWAGKGIGDDGSCIGFMKANLFDRLGIKDENIVFFNGNGDLSAECSRVDKFIENNGPIDYIMLGIGMNGHLGLNEPGTSFDLYSHVVELDETTKTVGQKYFSQHTQLSGGITMGMLHFRDAKRVVLMANGSKKAEIIKKLWESEPNEAVPASYLKKLNHASLYLDSDAASLISK